MRFLQKGAVRFERPSADRPNDGHNNAQHLCFLSDFDLDSKKRHQSVNCMTVADRVSILSFDISRRSLAKLGSICSSTG